MKNSYSLKKLHFEYEVLRARYEINEHYLRLIMADFYENIGQVLNLVRLELAEQNMSHEAQAKLLSQAIRDLRRLFHGALPEGDGTCGADLCNALEYELGLQRRDDTLLSVIRAPRDLEAGQYWILIRLLQEIFSAVRKQQTDARPRLKVIYKRRALVIILEYPDLPFDISSFTHAGKDISLFGGGDIASRTALLKASLRISNTVAAGNSIQLVVPFKLPI